MGLKSVLANYQGSLMKCWGGSLVMNWHPIKGEVVILLAASCQGNQHNLQLGGTFG